MGCAVSSNGTDVSVTELPASPIGLHPPATDDDASDMDRPALRSADTSVDDEWTFDHHPACLPADADVSSEAAADRRVAVRFSPIDIITGETPEPASLPLNVADDGMNELRAFSVIRSPLGSLPGNADSTRNSVHNALAVAGVSDDPTELLLADATPSARSRSAFFLAHEEAVLRRTSSANTTPRAAGSHSLANPLSPGP
uniref:Uncharacterized protein n=1 Tax=Neobodo designis TaxID=312471 RepID=A0A7S1KZI6_NEODS|eukprot:CAMPEP_0174850304 /NCGR_PEP_ID=MMETSP1114-20130205/19159_1 /TAXON_ID=312471 /ORGANISM="Neobodo designis, Strain CCAP 1951/1" /LENGTH=199 /DNA_ID=CAMNT_0016084759 /DNA_START=30 /DNA_END=629 /DNA_ORIENTATION=+